MNSCPCAPAGSVDLAPAGGSIARFTADGSIDLLRPATAEADRLGPRQRFLLLSAGAVLRPHRERPLRLRRREIVLAAQLAGRAPSHARRRLGAGLARRAQRRPLRRPRLCMTPPRRLALSLSRPPDLSSRGDTLSIGICIENLENRPVPAGLGLHPFFVRDADAELACRTPAVWRTDAEVLPTERIAVPPEWDFAQSRKVDEVTLDNGFEGWDGRATIVWPSVGFVSSSRRRRHSAISSSTFRPASRYFCVEPVSHATGRSVDAARGRRDAGRRGHLPSLQSVRNPCRLRFLSQPQRPRRLRLGRRLGHRRLDRRAFRRAGRQGGLRRHRRAGLEGGRGGKHRRRCSRNATCATSRPTRRRSPRWRRSSARSPCWSTTPRATTGIRSRR